MGTNSEDEVLRIEGISQMSSDQLQIWVPKTLGPLFLPPPPFHFPSPLLDPGCDSRQVRPQWSGLRQPFSKNWSNSRFSPLGVCLGPGQGLPSIGLTSLMVLVGCLWI
jgi:hypothetical protein